MCRVEKETWDTFGKIFTFPDKKDGLEKEEEKLNFIWRKLSTKLIVIIKLEYSRSKINKLNETSFIHP